MTTREELAAAGAELDQTYRNARQELLLALIPAGLSLLTLLGLRHRRAQLKVTEVRLDLKEQGLEVVRAVEVALADDREGLRAELVDGWEPTLFQGGRLVAQIPLCITTPGDARMWLEDRVRRGGETVSVDLSGDDEPGD